LQEIPAATSPFEGSARLTELTDGPHNLTVCGVFDYFSNPKYTMFFSHTESESTVFFTIDTKQPLPTVPVVAASAVTIAAVGLGLLLYFKKRKR